MAWSFLEHVESIVLFKIYEFLEQCSNFFNKFSISSYLGYNFFFFFLTIAVNFFSQLKERVYHEALITSRKKVSSKEYVLYMVATIKIFIIFMYVQVWYTS